MFINYIMAAVGCKNFAEVALGGIMLQPHKEANKTTDPFSRSFRPILLLLQGIGLNFAEDDNKEEGSRRSYVKIVGHGVYPALVLLFNIGWNVYYISNNWFSMYPNGFVLTADNVNGMVDTINVFIGNVGSHFALYVLCHQKSWKEFRISLKQLLLEQEQRLVMRSDPDYSRNNGLLRRSWLAAISITTFVGFNVSMIFYNLNWKDIAEINVKTSFNSIMVHVGFIYPIASCGFFCLLASAIAGHFRWIEKDLKGYLGKGKTSRTADEIELRRFRLAHGKICLVVEQFRIIFQWLSLIHVAFVFAGVINTSYILATQPVFSLSILLYTMECIGRLCLIGYFADLIRDEALASLMILATVANDNESIMSQSMFHQQQHLILGMQIHQTAPEFYIFGLFHLNRQLFPKLIGTTLTYLMILYQFR